jgi:hypothetical protein
MKEKFSLSGYYLFIFTLLSLSSCISLKHNYIGVAKRDMAIAKITLQQKAALDSTRRLLDLQMDSLLKIIVINKQNNRHITASEVNRLYSNFGSQLNYDRVFNAVLHAGKTRRKFLTPMQRYAGVQLLYSAAGYDSTYQRNKIVRRALNRGDIGNHIPRNILQRSRRFLYSPVIRKKLSMRKKGANPDAADSLLHRLPRTNIFKSAFYSVYRRNDRLYGLLYNVFPYVGQSLFGNVEDRISNRARQKKYAGKLLSVIQPYDILLSRAPGHLSAKVIPGYFGHASIWLGNDVPRKQKPLFRKIFKGDSLRLSIRQKGMAEALRSGVQLSNLIEYADGDEFIIIRPRTLSLEQKQSIVKNTMKHLKKRYDFNFDVESPDMVNCTELVYLAYDFIDWKVRYFMGRHTLFPDDLLITALENKEQFEIVALVKDGEITLNPDWNFLRSLVQ